MAERPIHRRDLIDNLEKTGTRPYESEAWRITRSGRSPLLGSTASGRWNRPGAYEVLYTSLERDGAMAEIGHRLELEPVWPSRLSHTITQLYLRLEHAIELGTLASLAAFGIVPATYKGYDYEATQTLADTVHFLGADALIVPNARYPCLNAVIFLDNCDLRHAVEIRSSEPVDWAAWRRTKS